MKKDDTLILPSGYHPLPAYVFPDSLQHLGKAIQKYREYLEDPEATPITVVMSASTATELVHLLERMEPVKPDKPEEVWRCGNCDEIVGWDDWVISTDNVRHNYCPKCGRAVLWDAESAADGGGQEGGAGTEG